MRIIIANSSTGAAPVAAEAAVGQKFQNLVPPQPQPQILLQPQIQPQPQILPQTRYQIQIQW